MSIGFKPKDAAQLERRARDERKKSVKSRRSTPLAKWKLRWRRIEDHSGRVGGGKGAFYARRGDNGIKCFLAYLSHAEGLSANDRYGHCLLNTPTSTL